MTASNNDNNTNFDLGNLLGVSPKSSNTPNYLVNSTALDQVINNQHMQIIKTAIPFLDYNLQRQLAVVIKIMELKNTVNIYSQEKFKGIHQLNLMTKPKEDMLQSVRTVCSDENKNLVDILINMLNINKLIDNFKNAKAQQQKQTPEESTSNDSEVSEEDSTDYSETLSDQTQEQSSNNNTAMIDSLKSMLSPEQQGMFDMMRMMMSMNNNNGKESQKNE